MNLKPKILVNSQPVAWAFLMPSGPGKYLLTAFFVDVAYRGEGHGRALLKLITRHAEWERADLVLTARPEGWMDRKRFAEWIESEGFTRVNNRIVRIHGLVQS